MKRLHDKMIIWMNTNHKNHNTGCTCIVARNQRLQIYKIDSERLINSLRGLLDVDKSHNSQYCVKLIDSMLERYVEL